MVWRNDGGRAAVHRTGKIEAIGHVDDGWHNGGNWYR
jgi:hypothetical protein